MQIKSLAATPVAFLLPSRSTHITAGKLALIGMLVTAFFLFTAGYQFPGGASHYPNWAEAIVRGMTLPATVAQREVGFPLLYILGTFPWSHSFIGITLILASFAVLIPVLVHWSLVRSSPTVAFYVGLACIISLSPVTFLKFFYPDQADMFFNLLALALLIEFLWSGRVRMLYFFTLAALAASFTRTAGNLMYPVLMTIAYVTVRGQLRHYLGCALIFVLATGLYQWHRYEIFDARHQASIPSYKGEQIFFGMYLQIREFGVRLSPADGPNSKHLLDKLRQQLQPNVRESPLIKRAMANHSPEFVENNVFAYTPEQLIEKISTEPNEDYFNILSGVESDDNFYLKLSWEIARLHPWYVIKYSIRGLWFIFFRPDDFEFMPAKHDWGTLNADSVTQYGPRATNEMKYFPLQTQPQAIQRAFAVVERLWSKNFKAYVRITSVLIGIAWIAVISSLLCWAFPRTADCRALMSTGVDKLMAPIIAASTLLLYANLSTAMFSQPNYRYFHITEPLRLVIAGFGVMFVIGVLSTVWPKRIKAIGATSTQPKCEGVVAAIQRYDLLDGYFGQRRAQWIYWLIAVNVSLFVWWTFSMIAQTWGAASPT